MTIFPLCLTPPATRPSISLPTVSLSVIGVVSCTVMGRKAGTASLAPTGATTVGGAGGGVFNGSAGSGSKRMALCAENARQCGPSAHA